MVGSIDGYVAVAAAAGNAGQLPIGHAGPGGGIVGVSGSVAVTYFESKTEASICGDANLRNIKGTIKVYTDGTTNATAAASAVSGGVGAASITTAVAVNRSRFEAFIGQGVTITDSENAVIDMDSHLDATARTIIVSVTAGVVGVGVSVAVAVNRPVSMTYIGRTPDNGEAVNVYSQSGTKGQITVKSVTIKNSVNAATEVYGVGVAGGGVAVNGAVALGFNRAKSYAAIYHANVTAVYTKAVTGSGSITVDAAMTGNTSVYVTSVLGGAASVGATVAVAVSVEEAAKAGKF